jgi:aminodeoxyfutalosine deaminase
MSVEREFLLGLPKAELHVHHVGSASPRIVAELAARHPASPVPTDAEELAKYFTFTDFAKFIEVYLSVVDLVQTPEDVRLLTYEVARDMAAQNVRYAELTVTPYTSVLRGIAAEAFCEAIEDARTAAERDLGVTLRWSFDIPGESGIPGAIETARIATEIRPDGLVSFGLGGPEIGVPRPQFAPYFDAARAAGLHSVPHAGETTGPQTIWDAVRVLKAQRIGHGTSAILDPALVDYLGEHGIVLEVCPTSNLATRAVASYDEHPLRAMVEAGLSVTINSDDPPMFSTDLVNEYAVATRLLELDEDGAAELARAAVRASFAEDSMKDSLIAEIDAYAGPWQGATGPLRAGADPAAGGEAGTPC